MPLTINVNDNTLAHKGSDGKAIATAPDVCLTPSGPAVVPVPYPNIAVSADLTDGTTSVKVDGGMMAAISGSQLCKSTGDEAGVNGGVASGTFIKEATWITYSFDVMLEGKNACRLTDKLFMNHKNTVCMAGFLQKLINLGMSLLDACKKLLERIKDWIGEGKTGKSNGIRGLEERMKQQREGGGLGVEGAPNFPVDTSKVNGAGGKSFPGGSNSWQRHDAEIEQQQKNLDNDIKEYDDKCGGQGPPVTQDERDWVKKPRPQSSEWTGPVYSPTVSTGPTTGQILTAVGLTALTIGAILCPFDGPAGDAAAGTAAAGAWARVFGTAGRLAGAY